MARPVISGGSRSKKPSVGQQRILRQIEKSNARKQLTTLKGIGGIVGNAILEGVGGPKARAAKAAVKTSAKVARAIAVESAGKKAKAPFGIYRKPAGRRQPRLRDTDNTPRKTTVRQQVGPKTKSGKFAEPKRKTKTNTQPPARTKTEKPKAEVPAVTKVGGRTIAINKRATTPGARKRQEAQLRIGRREFQAERERQAKLAAKRKGKDDTTTKTNVGIYSKSGTKYTVNVPRSSKVDIESRPPQSTIESRLASGAEKLDVTSRNASRPSSMSPAEWRRYAQVQREIRATERGTGVPVSKETIARGRARALQPTAERRAAILRATEQRTIAKAKARGMTDAQIKNMIAKAKAEAAYIAKKAAK